MSKIFRMRFAFAERLLLILCILCILQILRRFGAILTTQL